MTDHQFIEAKRLIANGMSINKAAAQVGVPYATLRRWFRKYETPQPATEPEPEPEPKYGTKEYFAKMDALERKRNGLPPLTESEQQQIDEAQRITDQHFKGVQFPPQ